MTVPLSPPKVRRLMKDFFRGLPQKLIGERIDADQSSVSHYVSELREVTGNKGILEAAKEYNVQHEVDELRSLATELYKFDITAVEARKGADIIKAFSKLGVDPEQHTALIKICREVTDPGFVPAAIKLNNIEQNSGLSYSEIIARFEKASKELPVVTNLLKDARAKIESAVNELTSKKQEMAAIQLLIAEAQKNEAAQEKELEMKLDARRKNLDVKDQEIEEVARLKTFLAENGLDISTLIKLAQEFKP